MSAGRSPRNNVIAGRTSDTTNATTFAMTIALIAGVSGPGPNEYARVEDDGYRDRMGFSLFQLRCAHQQQLLCPRTAALQDDRHRFAKLPDPQHMRGGGKYNER